MNYIRIRMLFAVSLLALSAGPACGFGRGGGGGGFHAAGVSVGGYSGVRAGEVGGYRAGGVGGYRAGEVGGYRAGEVGYRGGAVGGYRAASVEGVDRHVGMATDMGFGHVAGVAGGGYVRAGSFTRAYSPGVLAGRGAAVRGGFYHYGAFNNTWWGAHPGAWRPFGWNAANAWGWATWPALTGWFGWSAPPVYFDYGTTIVYLGDQVYIDDQPGPTAAVYYQQASDLALSAPPAPPPAKDEEWQPLGVFALVQGEQSDPSAVFQLAVNKDGIIRGNYFNVLTDTTLPVRGAVDKKTQRASWIVGDQKTTVYDTGIANLTRDESPLLIHFGKDSTQQWLLVRVPEKDATVPVGSTNKVTLPAAETSMAKIVILVPAEAELYFDGTLTTQTGTRRVFNTPALAAGTNYSYSVRAVWTEDGRPVQQTRTVGVRAGASLVVDFTSPLP